MSDDFDAAVAATLQPDPGQSSRVGFSAAYGVSPDAYAEAKRIERRTGIPADSVLANPIEAKREAVVGSINFDALAKTAPATAALLADVERAKVSHDDLDNLQGAENALKSWQGPKPSFASVASGFAETLKYKPLVAGMRLWMNDLMFGAGSTPEDQVRRADLVRKAGQALARQDYTTPAFESATAAGAYSGGVSILQNLPGLAASIATGSPAPGLAMASLNSAAPAYGEYAARGATIGESAGGALAVGAVEAATEALPMGFLVKNFGRVGAGQFLAGVLGREIPSEQVATLVQDLVDSAVANPDKTWQQYIDERPDAAYKTLIATITQIGVMGAASKIMQVASGRAEQAQMAEEQASRIEAFNQFAAASKVMQRDPQTFETFIAKAAEGAPVGAVFIDAQALLQSGVADQVAAASPSVAAQIAEAAQTGGTIAIPVEEYAARIAPTEAAGALLDHLRTTPDGFSRAEAQAYMQEQGAELQAEVERAIAESAPAFGLGVPVRILGKDPKTVTYKRRDDGRLTRTITYDDGETSEAFLVEDKDGIDRTWVSSDSYNDTYFPVQLNEREAEREAIEDAQSIGYNKTQGDFKAGIDAVRYRILDQLNVAGRFTPEARDSYATVVGNFYAVQAAKLGVTPDALYERYPLTVTAEEIGGNALDQGEVSAYVTDEIDDLTGLPLNSDGTVTVYHHTSAEKAEAIKTSGTLKAAAEPDVYVTTRKETDTGYGDVAVPVRVKPDLLQIDDEFPDGRVDYRIDAKRPGGSVKVKVGEAEAAISDAYEQGPRAAEIEVDGVKRSTTNSKGLPIHPTEEGVRNFWRWFGDSRAVDSEGRPLVVYHGTGADFDRFDLALVGRTFGAAGELGFFFSSNPETASKYSMHAGHGGGGNVMPVYVVIKSPIYRSDNFLRGPIGFLDWNRLSLKKQAEANRNDGVLIQQKEDGEIHESIVVAFRPEQIKSAIGNTGAFDPANPDILHQGPRGAFSPATWNIAILQDADLSTFLHETGHAFLEMQLDMAGRLSAIDELSPGEREVVADAEALMRWFGLRDLAEWQSLDFDERRPHHEKFARGFEAYLFEGKAPSIELQGLFQRFRAWLVNIYRDIKALNVELTDEVRGVMDRMIATGEQIQLAEQGRSMMPLFRTAEQAGMTPEEFAAYQALGIQATADAIEDLQARGLRDLQWIRNARGREIKRLQREAGVQRAQIRMEARREVMSQPVYRAWQFLTGKISEADKLPEPERIKSDPDIVDPGLDSLFVAVAKLGGINRESAAGLWGVKPEDKPQSGLFGKPVLRAEGKGWTVDQMAEKLAELGYLSPDENGNTALRDFEEAFQAEMGGSPVYSSQADYDLLRANDVRPGDQVANVDALTAGRLDTAGLSDIAPPPEVVAALKARRMTSPNGLHPDIVADLFGFSSGDELARTLAAANPPKEEIEALTDQRMLERFGELATPDAIARAADAAIHNAARGRMLATEANALAKATGQRKILIEAAREFAATMVARLKVRDIRPSQYANAEAKAARSAQKASQSGDLKTAAAEKRNELVNHYATRAAYDAQAEVRAILSNFAAFANRPDKRLGKAYDLDIANAARAILGEYGIAEKRAKKAGEYLKAVESYDPELYGVLKASLDAAEANAKPVQEMTVEEVRGLRDEIDAMLHLARRSRQMEIDGDLMDREDVENALFARLEEIGIPDTIPGEGQAVTPEEARRAKLRTFVAAARRVESWVGSMDGSVSMGPFRRFVFSRIKDAADSYRADKAAYLNRFRGLFDGIAPTLKPQLIAAPELGYTFGKDSGGSAMNEILHALLHTGNSSNKRKLLLGRGWAQQLPDGTLDTSRWDAFLRRMIVEEKITKAHFDFAQGVWDLLEDTKAGAQRTHRDVFGRYFDEVTAEPVKTPWGEYRGGYVPAMADARVVQDANLRALAEEDNAAMAYAFPTTPKGFTKARVEYNRPLTLDLRTLAQHIDKVLLFTHMEMPVRDVQRVMSKKVGQALARVDPEAIPAMIQPWLNRAAKQQVETPIAGSAGLMRFFSVMRARAGAAAMFANVSNAAQQVTGFALAAVKVRPGLMLSAAAEYIKAPRDMARTVAESSVYMASRMDNEVSVMNGEINDILLNPSLLEQGQNWTMRHAYFLQSAVDNVMGPIIWTAAYNQAVEAGETERDAVRLADAAIRETQGSSLPEDISRIEGGNAFVRLFTQFAGYFNMQANLLGSEFVKITRDGGLRQNAGRGLYVMGLGFLAPAIVAEAIAQAFRGGPDDADKDGEYLDDWIAAVFGWGPLRNITAMVPVVGQGMSAIINAANSKPYDDRLATSPAVSMLESAARAPFSAYKALAEDGSGQKAVRDVATLISMTVGLPANLAARPVGYLTGVAEGRIDPVGPVDAVRGTITGAASPESKR